MTIRPLDDRIVVRRLTPDATSKGGIVLPENAKDKPQQGRVLAVGLGRPLKDGSHAKPGVAVGDLVLFGKYTGAELIVDGQEVLILREGDVLAKLN